MAWRDEWYQPTPVRKAALRAEIEDGRPVGLLAYRAGTSVGWVAVSARVDRPRLERSRRYGPEPGDEDVFAITCCYVPPEHRGSGVASTLLDAAIEYAREVGATAVDAFPKVESPPHTKDSRRAEENDSWMGRRSSYQVRGFKAIREPGKRVVMRRRLR
ncbi:MAG TPA: GNAT family N-acetyltransferase [Microlunatus sp.]|nr:GNAT family N-acetyltransferase [Microlunatus sp.]